MNDLETYLTIISEVYFEPIFSIAEEKGTQGEAGYVPGYGIIFNPETCPTKWLPWLGMFVGVEVPKVATESEARKLVKEESGLERGTLKSLENVVERAQGNKNWIIQERLSAAGSPAAYHFNVIIPKGKIAANLKELIEKVKPGGLMFSIIEAEGIWLEGVDKFETVTAGKKWSNIVPGEY